MRRIDIGGGVSVNVADDATDEQIEAVKARHAGPPPRDKSRQPAEPGKAETGDDVPTKSTRPTRKAT